jgi:hypothetical protein
MKNGRVACHSLNGRHIFGQFGCVVEPPLEPLPDDVDGEALVLGAALAAGVAAWATTSVPNPMANPRPPAATNFAI